MSNYDFLGSFLGKKLDFKKDGHDLSNKEAMSFPFGTIVPKKCMFCVPNMHIKARTGTYVQTGPMREDNFQEIYLNQKAVFVPLDSICRDYISLTSSGRSTLKDPAVPDAIELTMDINELISWCAPIFFGNRLVEEVISLIPNWSDCTFKWDSDSDGAISSFSCYYYDAAGDEYDVELPESNSFMQYLHYKFVSDIGLSSSFILDVSDLVNSLYNFKTPSGSLWCFDCLRLLDSLGYGNHFPFMEAVIQDVLSGSVDYSEFFCWDTSDNWLTIHPLSEYDGIQAPFLVRNIYKLVAYQFACATLFKSTYRQPVTSLLTVDYISDYFNMHSATTHYGNKVGTVVRLQCSETHLTSNDFGNLREALNDAYFTDKFQSKLYQMDFDGDPGDRFFLLYALTCLSNPLLDSDLFTTMQQSVVTGSIPTTTSPDFNANPIQQMADLSALYKLRQDLLRSGVKRDKQMSVMFGVSDHDGKIVEPVIVCDSSKSSVNIQSLINQAETDVAALGERGSRGNGSCSLEFELNTKDFGYLFFIDYYTCPTYYENFGVDRADSLAMSSWFNPRNNYLGLEAVYNQQNSLYILANRIPVVSDLRKNTNQTVVLGYSFRDAYLKQQVNRTHGYFTSLGMPLYNNGVLSDLPYALKDNQRGNAAFGGYVCTMIDQQLDQFTGYASLYFNPYMLNGIFVNMFDGAVHGSPKYDQFRTITNYEIHVVAPYPKMGLIKLD